MRTPQPSHTPTSTMPPAAHARTAAGIRTSIICIVCNIALCAAKAAAGFATGSAAVVADAMNNLSDASSNIVTLLGFKLAARKPDAEHPFGHGRYEYLAGLIVAVLVAGIGVGLIVESVSHITQPHTVELTCVLVAVMAASVLVKAGMARLCHKTATSINSQALEAAAADSKSDILTTLATLAAAAGSVITGINLDSWAGLVVGGLIVANGIQLIRSMVDSLLGAAPDPELVEHITQTILSYPGVLGTHGLMVHNYGPGHIFASAHVEMAAEADPLKTHELITEIEDHFADEGIPMVIHYDPVVTQPHTPATE